MALATSTRIIARLECVQGHGSRVNMRMKPCSQLRLACRATQESDVDPTRPFRVVHGMLCVSVACGALLVLTAPSHARDKPLQ